MSPKLVSRLLVTVTVLLVVAIVGGGIALWHQGSQLDDLEATVTAMQKAADTQATAQAAQQKKTQSQVAGIAAALTATQQRLAQDEKKLKVTEAQLPPDVTALAKKVSPSVVLISCASGIGTGFSLALTPSSGFGSVIVTAAHVVSDCSSDPSQISITREDQSFGASLSGLDVENDVAVLQVKPKVPALKPSSSAPRDGEFVMVVGNPLGITNSVTQGNVSKVTADLFTHTAAVSSGNSGGPLVDRDGTVLGIVQRAGNGNPDASTVIENLNIAARLKVLCDTILSGSQCTGLN